MITLIGQEFYLAWSRGNRQGSLPASRITVTSLAKGSSSKSPSITTSTSYCTFPQIFKAELKYFFLGTRYFLPIFFSGWQKNCVSFSLKTFDWIARSAARMEVGAGRPQFMFICVVFKAPGCKAPKSQKLILKKALVIN